MSFKLRYTCTPAYVCPSFCGIRYFEQTPVDTRVPSTECGKTVKLLVCYIYTSKNAQMTVMSRTSIVQIIFHRFIFVVKSKTTVMRSGTEAENR